MNTVDKRQNNSLESINSNDRLFVKLLFNIFTLFSLSFAIIISLFIIVYVLVIYNLRRHSKNSLNVSLLLTCNTCLAIICSSITIVLIQLASISGDRNVVSLKWIILWGCRFRGYLLFVFADSIYLSYVLQAGYRLFRIVFYQIRCLRVATSFLYYIVALWIISFIAFTPILVADKNLTTPIIYLPEEFYCQVPATNIYVMSYSTLAIFLLPLCCLITIYLWIIIYIRCNAEYAQSTSIVKSRCRNQRDTTIIKRICVVVLSLSMPAIVSIISFMTFVISGHLHWAYYRLSWMVVSTSYALICLSSIYVTPEIYKPIKILFRPSTCHQRNPRISASISLITKTSTKTEYSTLRKVSTANMIELDVMLRETSHAQRN